MTELDMSRFGFKVIARAPKLEVIPKPVLDLVSKFKKGFKVSGVTRHHEEKGITAFHMKLDDVDVVIRANEDEDGPSIVQVGPDSRHTYANTMSTNVFVDFIAVAVLKIKARSQGAIWIKIGPNTSVRPGLLSHDLAEVYEVDINDTKNRTTCMRINISSSYTSSVINIELPSNQPWTSYEVNKKTVHFLKSPMSNIDLNKLLNEPEIRKVISAWSKILREDKESLVKTQLKLLESFRVIESDMK